MYLKDTVSWKKISFKRWNTPTRQIKIFEKSIYFFVTLLVVGRLFTR
jgi:hypothetical protein